MIIWMNGGFVLNTSSFIAFMCGDNVYSLFCSCILFPLCKSWFAITHLIVCTENIPIDRSNRVICNYYNFIQYKRWSILRFTRKQNILDILSFWHDLAVDEYHHYFLHASFILIAMNLIDKNQYCFNTFCCSRCWVSIIITNNCSSSQYSQKKTRF